MKKKLLWVGVCLLAIPTSLWATPPTIKINGPSYPPSAIEACVGGAEPSGTTILTFVNTTAATVTITSAQLPGITTPTSIPPNGTVTFKIPPAVQGIYTYSVDGCQ